jgi:hypothetical protein
VLVAAALYFGKHFNDPIADAMTPAEIKSLLLKGGVPKARKMNVGQALAEASPDVHRAGPRGIWAITETGEKKVERLVRIPGDPASQANDVAALAGLVASQPDDAVRGYLEEAIKCLEVDALRAAVVFLWAGAVRTLHEGVIEKGRKPLNAALLKFDSKSREVKKVEDFAYVKDKWLLLAAGELGMIDKGERGTLEEALNLRNRCGHPTKYRPRSVKVSAYIEDVVGIVF